MGKDWDFEQGGTPSPKGQEEPSKSLLEDDDLFAIPEDVDFDEKEDINVPDIKINNKDIQETPSLAAAPAVPKEPQASATAPVDSKPPQPEKASKQKAAGNKKQGLESSIPNNPTIAAARDSYPVLVIDDDKWIQKIFKQYLETWGFEYIGALNSVDGLKKALTHKPIAIFLDIVMPDVYGDITLRFIKGFEESKDAPVVIISGNLSKNVLRQTYQDGAVGFITKPFTKDTLKEKVLSVIGEPVVNRMQKDGKLHAGE